MNGIRAYFKLNDLVATSGQPSEEQFSEIANAGYSLVINLALPTSNFAIPNESEIIESLGMSYVHMPVDWDEPKLSDLHNFFSLMQGSEGKKIWVHCALNMRVSCFMYLYRLLILKLPESEAKYPMSEIWQPTGAWEALVNAAKNEFDDAVMNVIENPRPPLPPFTLDAAMQKARMAEDAWNSRDPVKVSLAYTHDSVWRNRSEFFSGREAIVQFLTRKWEKELDYRLIKELWAFQDNRIAVRFAYEWHDVSGNWYRSYGNENWEFDQFGFMRRRIASINDLAISASERKLHWPPGRRPDDYPTLSELNL